MRDYIPTINNFLAIASDTNDFTPKEYLNYVITRMAPLGFILNVPKELDLSSDYGDVYILIDQWQDALATDVNQLFVRNGEHFYLNILWMTNGLGVVAHVVPESELDEEETEDEAQEGEVDPDEFNEIEQPAK